ncbi:MAG TPA: hypothetical protein PKG52_07615 [bacterium]|nr:hypothetical protein [bacterium]HPS29115.1 hypothetical protein [bacterium]
MRKSVFLLIIISLLSTTAFFSCSKEQPIDRKQLVAELVAKGEYSKAKLELVTLRGLYPNDQSLVDLSRQCDEKLAEDLYKKYWEKAEKSDNYDGWIEAMINIKKVENINHETVDSLIKKAAEKCVDAGAKKLSDGLLLGLLDKLVQRYQVISPNDRLMYITMFVKEGRFPLKEWKDTFTTKFPELMDPDTEEFVGWPRPEKAEKEKKK